MMTPVVRIDGRGACPLNGTPVLNLPKAAWNGMMLLAVVALAAPMFTWGAFGLFLGTTYATLLVGHSVGMHRLMILRSFRCAKPVERVLIYIGVLVGVAGPFGIIGVHDLGDWAQRRPRCHEFFAHTRSLPLDPLWQLTCDFRFRRAPVITIEPRFADDRFYRFLERTWRWQQLPVAMLFYALGGWPWVVWGVCVRVIVSATGHWTITYSVTTPAPAGGACPAHRSKRPTCAGLSC